MMTVRKYPIGIQTFSEIIKGGYVYIDKTDLVWQLLDIYDAKLLRTDPSEVCRWPYRHGGMDARHHLCL